MRYYRFAVRVEREVRDATGKAWRLSVVGQSNESLEAARADAERRLDLIPVPPVPRKSDSEEGYSTYQWRPTPEELLRELCDDHDSNVLGVLTRNRQGCIVLNVPDVPFFDVDMPVVRPWLFDDLWDWLSPWFKRGTPPPAVDMPLGLDALLRALGEFPELAFRIYQTAAGYRVVLLNQLLPPDHFLIQSLFDTIGCDPLYRKLCATQECYRARLTPKPWRIELSAVEQSFPRQTPEAQRAFEAWLQSYERQSKDFAVCRWLQDTGARVDFGDLPAATRHILSIHDAFTLHPTRPLA